MLPSDEALGVKPDLVPDLEDNEDIDDNEEYAARVTRNLKIARETVIEKLRIVHLNQKAEYDKKRRDHSYSVGDLVLIYKPIRKVGRSEKLLHQWLGPYQVIRRTTDLNYEVKLLESKTGKTEIVHVVAMKQYHNADRPKAEMVMRTTSDLTDTDAADSVSGVIAQPEPKRKPGRPKKTVAFQDDVVPVHTPTADPDRSSTTDPLTATRSLPPPKTKCTY